MRQPPELSEHSVRTPTAWACGCGIAAGLLALSVLAGCATAPTDPAERAAFEENNDPIEPLNRQIFGVNQFVDRILLLPVAKVYVAVIPQDGRDAIKRILDNMKEPTLFINNVLQGEFDRAGVTLGRFTINTTVGLVGVFDVAGKWGLKTQPADFGQTLFVWGVPQGPYLILPFFGPSNPRDGVGLAVDSYADPFTVLANEYGVEELMVGRFVVSGIDKRAQVMDVLDELQRNSLDFYAELRSLSQQQRAADLRHGAAASPDQNFYTDPDHSAPRPTPSQPAPAPAPAPPQAPPQTTAPANPEGSAPLRWDVADPEEGPIISAPGSTRP